MGADGEGLDERIGAGGAPADAEREHEAVAAEVVAAALVLRVGRQARVAHLVDLGVAVQPFGEHGRVALRALEPQRQRAQAAQAQERLERAGGRAAQLACLVQRVECVSAAATTAPRSRSEWPPIALVALWTTRSAPSSSGRWSSGVAKVLSTMEHPALARDVAQARQVGDAEQRVGRRLDPQHVRPVAGRDHRVGVGDVDESHLGAARLLQSRSDGGRPCRRRPARRRSRRAGTVRCGGRRRHPGRERHRAAAFEGADHLFERRPRSVVPRAYPDAPPACNAEAGVIGTFIGPSGAAAGRPSSMTSVSG